MSYLASFDGYCVMGNSRSDRKGGEVTDVPVYEGAKVELMTNLKTGQAPGITASPSLLARAEVIK